MKELLNDFQLEAIEKNQRGIGWAEMMRQVVAEVRESRKVVEVAKRIEEWWERVHQEKVEQEPAFKDQRDGLHDKLRGVLKEE